MQYEDLRIQIRPGQLNETARVTLLSESRSETEEPLGTDFVVDDIPEVMARLQDNLSSCMRAHFEATESAKQLAALRRQIAQSQHEWGLKLFDALVHGRVGDSFDLDWHAFVDQDHPKKKGLRVRLIFNPEHDEIAPLAALPWELMVRRKGGVEEALSQMRKATLVREIETHLPYPSASIEGPLRILVVVASPAGLYPIDAKKEIAAIREGLAASPWSTEVESLHLNAETPHQAVTLMGLRNRLLEGRFHGLHFIGHGGFSKEGGFGVLSFVGQQGQEVQESGKMVATYLKGLPDLRLVVLCSCSGATLPRQRGQNPFLNVAPALLAANIPAVVAMQLPISIAAASIFNNALYRSLGRAEPIDMAVNEARLALYAQREVSFEWATPTLLTRAKDCNIVRRDQAASERRPAAVQRPKTQHLGIRTFKGGWGAAMESRCKELYLDLSGAFDPSTKHRLIRDQSLWDNDILPRLSTFLADVDTERPVLVDLAAHNSIAFVVGSFFEAKSGLDITLRQRGHRRADAGKANTLPAHQDWSADEGEVPEDRLWHVEDILPGEGLGDGLVVDAEVKDIALAISITHDVRPGVVEYLRRKQMPVRRILAATVQPQPGQTGIVSGAHALRLAIDLSYRLGQRSVLERQGLIRLFAAAPSIFMVLLGQQAKTFGAVQLYEHDLESGLPWAYLPSILKIPPRWQEYQ